MNKTVEIKLKCPKVVSALPFKFYDSNNCNHLRAIANKFLFQFNPKRKISNFRNGAPFFNQNVENDASLFGDTFLL